MQNIHSFHVPVMGTGFTIDTPIKVAPFGIHSVVSLVDDTLIEQMRQFYCEQMGFQYEPITKYDEDYRARRITEYLDLMDFIVKKRFEEIRQSCFEIGSEITKYFEMLQNDSPLRQLYDKMMVQTDQDAKLKLQDQLRSLMQPGEIQVNIMTKLDRPNFNKKTKEPLGDEYSDALAALRGFAQSKIDAAIVFSAGFNRRLYAYLDKFEDFFPDTFGKIKKRVILKVSDYRSSIIQGRFLAKKGIWVSEYRVESGLNCGGHAFASDGFLLGPILEEFKQKKDDLISSLHQIYNKTLASLEKQTWKLPLPVEFSAQGGIGNIQEDQFLLNHYHLDRTGWGSPFLLVPEVTNVEDETLLKLIQAQEKDLYLSPVSPLGVPFNNLRGSVSDEKKMKRVVDGKPGSACPKGHLVTNTEFTDKPICTASRQYQVLKLKDLKDKNLPDEEYQRQYMKTITKACICHDLGDGVLIKNNVKDKHDKLPDRFPAVCPGPNIAYFNKVFSMHDMIDHIYGRKNVLNHDIKRPNFFIKELKMYVDYLLNEVEKTMPDPTQKDCNYLNEFMTNLNNGIAYYRELCDDFYKSLEDKKAQFIDELDQQWQRLANLAKKHQSIFNLTPDQEEIETVKK